MIPFVYVNERLPYSIPRESGDDPLLNVVESLQAAYSPRERG